jgi:hypothetical protein
MHAQQVFLAGRKYFSKISLDSEKTDPRSVASTTIPDHSMKGKNTANNTTKNDGGMAMGAAAVAAV